MSKLAHSDDESMEQIELDNTNYEYWPVDLKLREVVDVMSGLENEPQSPMETKLRYAVAALAEIIREVANQSDERGFVRGYRTAHTDLGMPVTMADAMTPTPAPQESANPSPPHGEQSTTRLSASTPTPTETNSNEIP